GCDVDAVFRVFAKLEFKQGAPLTMFRQALAFAIPEVPGCETIPVPQAYAIRDELLLMFESASTQGISSLDWFSSVISSNGRPEAVLRNKRVSADACRTVIKQAQNSVFRYADVGGCLQLGSAKGQKDVLRQ